MKLRSTIPMEPLPAAAQRSRRPVIRIQRILVPVDFSEATGKAVEYAASIAEEFGAEIVLMHVVAPCPTVPDMPALSPNLETVLAEDAAAQLAKLEKEIRGVPCRHVVRNGNPPRIIVQEAQVENADLIVTSTHGRTGLAHVFIGSVAEQLVRLAKCPVLVVREREHEFLASGDPGAAN